SAILPGGIRLLCGTACDLSAAFHHWGSGIPRLLRRSRRARLLTGGAAVVYSFGPSTAISSTATSRDILLPWMPGYCSSNCRVLSEVRESPRDMKPMPNTDEKPPIAVVGAGYWGVNHVRNFAEIGALAAVCDANPASLDSVSRKYPGVRTETD